MVCIRLRQREVVTLLAVWLSRLVAFKAIGIAMEQRVMSVLACCPACPDMNQELESN